MIGRLYRVSEEERQRIQRDLASELRRDPAVAFAYVYGSFVESQAFHDIDVGVYLRDLPVDRATSTALALAQHLSERARKPVDVRALNLAPVSFIYHVLRGRLVFCRDAALLAEVMERTVCRFLDMAPLLRRGTQEAFAA